MRRSIKFIARPRQYDGLGEATSRRDAGPERAWRSLRPAFLGMMAFLAACESSGDPSPQGMQILETSTREYKGCVTAAITGLGPRTRAYHAVARAAESVCSARRDDVVSAAETVYGDSDAENYLEALDAWVVVEARRILSRG